MGSGCGTEDFMMEIKVISNGSDAISPDDETMMRSMALREELKDDDLISELSGLEEHERENDFRQNAFKEIEVAKPMAASAVGESKSQEDNSLTYDQADKLYDHESEIVVCSEIEAQESSNSIQQYSRSVPFSGSISLRSTSSTTSARSFAFPVLAEEWNGSPVRMAKPDKRLLRKRKSWKMRLSWMICCKF